MDVGRVPTGTRTPLSIKGGHSTQFKHMVEHMVLAPSYSIITTLFDLTSQVDLTLRGALPNHRPSPPNKKLVVM